MKNKDLSLSEILVYLSNFFMLVIVFIIFLFQGDLHVKLEFKLETVSWWSMELLSLNLITKKLYKL